MPTMITRGAASARAFGLFANLGAYTISRSLRFNLSASAYLNRTPSSASNRRTWTWSGWAKRGAFPSAFCTLFNAGTVLSGNTGFFGIRWTANQTLDVTTDSTDLRQTTQVFRDPSAWYHIIVAVDTTQATGANRVKVYINGSEVTAFGTSNDPAQNLDTAINNNVVHEIGRTTWSTNGHFDGYLTEVNFIDGQQLTPSSFGKYNTLTGVWEPIRYVGTYGTNGFYLNFSDNSAATAAAIGKDSSGNGNNWTPNNISVTAGATYDSMIDVPIPYSDGTAYNRGNYCVMNPVAYPAYSSTTFSNANLTITGTASNTGGGFGTMAVPRTGKWYMECTMTANAGGNPGPGLYQLGTSTYAWVRYAQGMEVNGGIGSFTGTLSFTTNDVVGIAVDNSSGTGTIYIYVNGTLQCTGGAGCANYDLFPWCQNNAAGTTTFQWNFGQRPFAYSPPSGHVALNTFNLSTPNVVAGASYMQPTLYTGNGTTTNLVNTTSQGFGFQPDLVWQKNRTSAANNILVDSVRGGNLYLISNTTGADASAPGYMTFNSNGVSFTSSSIETNQSGQNYVAWQWRAGGTSSTNTSGSITSTVSVNTTAGFSIATYTGTGSAGTIGHGLGATPNMIIVKARSLAGRNWSVYHSALGPTYVTWLNLTSASSNTGRTGYWNDTSPTSTVFTVGSDNDTNANTYTYIAYCWAAISGFSAFGKYTGNGSTDGPFVYTGFKPKYIMWKNTSTSSTEWIIQDTARQTYNAAPNNSYNLSADSSAKENDATVLGGPTNANNIDWLSNGFKIRYNNGNCNTNGNVYIYAAFAENPFKYALAQ